MDDSSLFMRLYTFKGLIDIKEERRTKNITRLAEAETGKQHFPSHILSIQWSFISKIVNETPKNCEQKLHVFTLKKKINTADYRKDFRDDEEFYKIVLREKNFCKKQLLDLG